MVANILAVLGLIKEALDMFKQAWELYKQAKKEGWMQDGQSIATQIQGATSDAQRRDMVKKLAEHLSNMPSP